MLNILIIGSGGYIGTSLTEYLQDKFNVDTMDISSVSKPTFHMNYKDITTEIVQRYSVIILLAGNSSVKNSVNMVDTFENNCSNFIHLLDLITTQKFIYASSGSVYGKINNHLFSENEKHNTSFNYYDASKNFIDIWAGLSGKQVFGLRFGTVNGFSKNFRNDVMINCMVDTAINNNNVFTIQNKHILRAILGMKDLVKSVETIIENGNESNKGIYNLASFTMSVENIALAICSFVNFTFNEERGLTVYDFGLDTSLFIHAFDFKFEETVETITNSILQNYSLITLNKGRDYHDSVWKCREKSKCRVCNSSSLETILDLGNQPLANDFHNNSKPLDTFPLCLNACTECTHLQLSHVVNPNILFKNYIYVSGTSKTLQDYFVWFANMTTQKHCCNKRVLEIACNDGSQLDAYRTLGWETIGVDPAENLYPLSKNKGHNIYCDYWSLGTASKIKQRYNTLDLIIAENVFAHVDDVYTFLQCCEMLMDSSSRLYIQTSQADMVELNQYDTVYHEHLSFFNVHSMRKCLESHNLQLLSIQKTDIHGTSFIFEMGLKGDNSHIVFTDKILTMDMYKYYATQCISSKYMLIKTLLDHKHRTIVGYGASAKGNTILNFISDNGAEFIDYIVDDNPSKWGLYTPGTNILICSPEKLYEYANLPVSIVMLTWNFEKEIKKKIEKFKIKDLQYIYTQ
jgi:nucleoside-diphosphate-sugar epimerase/2-polyprenyl-3-methyl-5-hydroxy-6-metoxy-1,4-benzoquinol methylase